MFVQSSAARTPGEPAVSPSAEALGYFLSVRFADEEKILLRQNLSNRFSV
jgi:hypothetical protein